MGLNLVGLYFHEPKNHPSSANSRDVSHELLSTASVVGTLTPISIRTVEESNKVDESVGWRHCEIWIRHGCGEVLCVITLVVLLVLSGHEADLGFLTELLDPKHMGILLLTRRI